MNAGGNGAALGETIPGETLTQGAKSLPLVSICMSAYNVERFLPMALDSVLAQAYPNLEILVLDNGSGDRTYEIAQTFHDPRLRCFRVPRNLGAYQAMNRLAGMARGEFLAIYHSDDVYEPAIVEKEVAYLRSHPALGAVFCLDHFIDENGRIFGGASMPTEFVGRRSLNYEDVFRYFVRKKNTLLCCPTFMTRRAVFEAVGPFRPEKYEILSDVEMWLRIARQYPIAILNERLIRYRKGDHQWSARYRNLRTERDGFFDLMDEFLEKEGWRDRLTEAEWVEYAFHRCDDNTFRAVNHILLGDSTVARYLLSEQAFPWRTFANGIRRRKLRLIILRALLWSGLGLGATPLLARLLRNLGP
jgi:glycosyltransferase involved in cell wall biosynthesis